MSPASPRSPLLCDAVIVIEAHALEVWEPLVARCRVAVPGVVVEESRFYRDRATRQRRPTRLREAVEQSVVERLDATAEEIAALNGALDSITIEGLHGGEREALALMYARTLPHRFCTAEEIATRALCHLGFHDRAVSLEQVLRECGLMKPLKPHFRDAVFRRWRDRGIAEWIQRSTPRPEQKG